jgi:hypothetical protein
LLPRVCRRFASSFPKNLSAVRSAGLECDLSRKSTPKAFPSWVGIVTRLTSNEPYEGRP